MRLHLSRLQPVIYPATATTTMHDEYSAYAIVPDTPLQVRGGGRRGAPAESAAPPPPPPQRLRTLRQRGVPPADIREDFSATQGLHPLSLYEVMPWLVSPGLSLAWFGKACTANLLATFAPAAHTSPPAWWSEEAPKAGPRLCQPAVAAAPYAGSQRPPTIAFIRLYAAKRSEDFMWTLRDVLAEGLVVSRERSAEAMAGAGIEGWRQSPEAEAYAAAWGRRGAGTLPDPPAPVPWFAHEWRIVTREELPVYVAAGWKVRGGAGAGAATRPSLHRLARAGRPLPRIPPPARQRSNILPGGRRGKRVPGCGLQCAAPHACRGRLR
jgi:hypothetical protein